MDAMTLRRALLAAVIAAGALAQPLAHAESEAQACELPGADVDPLADRAGLLARYQRVPQACLQALFAECNSASSQALLDFGSAATCSLAYEALLSQRLHGNFRALLAWWRTQQPAEPR